MSTDTLTSANGRFNLVLQDDGNVAAYDQGIPYWSIRRTFSPLPPAPTPVPTPPQGDIDRILCNFGSTWDPVTNRPIFQGMFPSMERATQLRWLEKFKGMGDTHFQVNNPTTRGEYHDKTRYTNWLLAGKMTEFCEILDEILSAGFYPIVFADSGDTYPGPGYHAAFSKAIPKDIRAQSIVVAGHEVVRGGYTTNQLLAATVEMDGMWYAQAFHGSDGRLSPASHPVEPDDPFHGDEISPWRSRYGRMWKFYFHQSELFGKQDVNAVGGAGERTKECLYRVIGGHAHEGHPDWFAGLDYRPIPVFWESDEELYFQRYTSRQRMLDVSAWAERIGFQGFGCRGVL